MNASTPPAKRRRPTPAPSQPSALAPQNLADPMVLHSCHQAKQGSLNAYLVALAAFTRGLEVRFYYELVSQGHGFGQAQKSIGPRGGLFSLSDGHTTHYFQNTLGDRTPAKVGQLLKDKHATKQALIKAGITCPPGVVVERTQHQQLQAFLRRRGLTRFVLKPFSGSLSQGVFTDLDAQQALACAQTHPDDRLIVEAYIPGPEYRVAVVADQCVAVFEKRPAQVVGDGQHTLAQLIETKNQQRKQNPHLADKLIQVDADLKAYLSEQQLSLESVPAQDQVIQLMAMASVVRGGEAVDRTDDFPAAFKHQAVAAAQAVGVPNCGMDVIVSESDGQMHILEINARAHISGHAFVSQGGPWTNRVAEAIVDDYFPASINWPRQPLASFDLQPLVAALSSGAVHQVGLPLLQAAIQHRRLPIETQDPQLQPRLRQLIQEQGLYGSLLATSRGVVCDLLGRPEQIQALIEALKAAKQAKQETPAKEAPRG